MTGVQTCALPICYDIIASACSANKAAAMFYRNNSITDVDYGDFINKAIEYYNDEKYENLNSKDMNLVDKIFQAGYSAYSKYGGFDLHFGNIGFLKEKPEVLFYFDM